MKKAILILLIIPLFSCLKESPLNLESTDYIPRDINDGLLISSPEQEGIDQQLLNDVYALSYTDERFWSIRSLLVFRNGKLVSEAYHKDPDDISNRHLIWSCTKQVVAVLTGIALDEGVISSIDDPISTYFGDKMAAHPDKAAITLRNLLMMRSGIDFENDGVKGETDELLRQIPDDITEFILSRPMNAEPGEFVYYKDGDPQLVVSALQEVLGEPFDVWADRVLFSKIGVENINWVRYKDGVTFGGFGIETTPREMAKIALLVQDKGIFQGDTIVSPSWIEEMITPGEEGVYTNSFGLLWWIDQSRNIHYMNGHGGQYAFIVPDKDLLVVTTAIPNTQGRYQLIMDDGLDLTDMIIDACD